MMRLEKFRGRDLASALSRVRRALGRNALVLRTGVVREDGEAYVDVAAIPPGELRRIHRMLAPSSPTEERADGASRIRPRIVAVVGPPGSGKTSSVIKVALHPRGFGDKKVGLLTLDTYRVGALEEVQTYAEIAGLPLEVAYHRRDLQPAVRRLRECDVILVDTPGRWPAGSSHEDWSDLLLRLEPDEVHLTMPGWAPTELIRRTVREGSAVGVSHGLITQVDRIDDSLTLLQAVEAAGLSMRWVTDGPEMPADIASAGERILGAAGFEGEAPDRRAG